MVRFFQEYTEPDENSSGSQVPSHRRDVNPLHPTSSTTEEDKVLLPLGEDTLSQNLGIPIVVVITKVRRALNFLLKNVKFLIKFR